MLSCPFINNIKIFKSCDESLNFSGQQTRRNSSLDDWSRVKYMHEYIRSLRDMLRYLYFQYLSIHYQIPNTHPKIMSNIDRNGLNIKGYFVWSFLDAFELLGGYEASYG